MARTRSGGIMLTYEYYKQLREEEGPMPFAQVPNERVIDMYVEDQKTDKEIGELFNVTASAVQKRRNKLGISVADQALFKHVLNEMVPEFKNDLTFALFKLYKNTKDEHTIKVCRALLDYAYYKELPDI